MNTASNTDYGRGGHAHADRYRSFLQLSTAGTWYCALQPAVQTSAPVFEQIEAIIATGVIEECNDAMVRMYGLPGPEGLVGSRLADTLMAHEGSCAEQLRAFVDAGYQLAGVESVERAADGSTRHFVLSLVGVTADGLLEGIWGSLVDVTETKRLERQELRSHTIAALNRLAGGVAHDFNNLLTTILTSIELLEETLEPTHVGRHDALEIRRAARRGAELTRQLLALSQQQVLVARPADLNGVVRRAVNTLRRALPPTVDVGLNIDALPAMANLDSDEFEQVVVNLGSFAAESMRNVGRITVDVRAVSIEDSLSTTPDRVERGEYVVVRCSDSAPPFSAASEAYLFEPFFGVDLAASASGLALATLHGFAKQSGAFVTLDSPTSGRAISIYFPRVSPAATGDAHLRPTQTSASSGTVLIAEDEPTVRLLMKRVLQRAGFTVLVASTGEEAMELAHAYGSRIDALVTDVIMPGMGGGELARRLRLIQPGIRVLHVSGYTAGALRLHEALEDGAAFLQKPFAPTALLARLNEVLAT